MKTINDKGQSSRSPRRLTRLAHFVQKLQDFPNKFCGINLQMCNRAKLHPASSSHFLQVDLVKKVWSSFSLLPGAEVLLALFSAGAGAVGPGRLAEDAARPPEGVPSS